MAKRKEIIIENKPEEIIAEEQNKEEQVKQQNRLLKNFFITIGIIVLVFFMVIFFYNLRNNFKYDGLDFERVKFCDSGPPCLITYKTSLPVKVEGKNITISTNAVKTNDYNFYLRNDPRKLSVDFNGTISLKRIMVLNSTEDFVCNGNGGIAGANLVQLYNILGTKVIKDENATCDSQGRYMFVNLQEGNKTSIEQFGPSCYNINIKDCEILEGTEKFMIETFLKVNNILNNQTNQG